MSINIMLIRFNSLDGAHDLFCKWACRCPFSFLNTINKSQNLPLLDSSSVVKRTETAAPIAVRIMGIITPFLRPNLEEVSHVSALVRFTRAEN